MFRNILDTYRQRMFVKNAVPKTAEIVDTMLLSQREQQKHVCIKAIVAKGPEAISAFRKQMLQEVLRIVNSDSPDLALKKLLIENLELDRKSRLLLTDEFRERRQMIFDELNKSVVNPTQRWNDTRAAGIAIQSEATILCLRTLEKKLAEKSEDGDWWPKYLLAYHKYIESFYRSVLTRGDGRKGSIYEYEAEDNRKAVENLRMALTGEVPVNNDGKDWTRD